MNFYNPIILFIILLRKNIKKKCSKIQASSNVYNQILFFNINCEIFLSTIHLYITKFVYIQIKSAISQKIAL